MNEALDDLTKRVRESFPCPACGVVLTKDDLVRVFDTLIDRATGSALRRVKLVPVLISYRLGGLRLEKAPDRSDFETLDRVESLAFPLKFPTTRFPIEQMYHGSRIAPKGFTHIHHFFLPRAAQALGALWQKAGEWPEARIRHMLLFFVEQAIWGMSVLNRYQPIQQGRPGGSQVNRQISGVYYISSQISEVSPRYNLGLKLDRLQGVFSSLSFELGSTVVSTSTCSALSIPDRSVDYIFTDPPFGENIFYADLNYLVEAWHKRSTFGR